MPDWPSTWATTDLGTLIHRIEAGLNVKCLERPPELGERGLVKISAVTWGRFDERQSKTLPADVVVEERNRIHSGDLLLSRANTIELVGASVIVGPIARTLYLSDKVLRLVVDEHTKRWINYALKTSWMRKAIEDASSGNQLSMRNLSQGKLRALPIPVTSTAEQQRIADKLDAVLARMDACRDRMARVASLLNRFRRSVLAAAFAGRIYVSVTAAPQSFGMQPLSALADMRLGKMLDQQKNTGSPVPYLGNINVRWFGFQLDSLKSMSVEDGERKEFCLKDGDVLICEGGEPGRCAVWKAGSTEIVYQKALHRVRPDSGRLLPMWLALYMKHCSDAHLLDDLLTGSTIRHLTGVALAKLLVPLPDVETQAKIVDHVRVLFAYADRLEARLSQAQTAVDHLTPSLLAKAFRGELVSQDPADGPASGAEVPVREPFIHDAHLVTCAR